MLNFQDIISYGVAVIGCLIGVSGYFSTINAKANKDGQLLERIDQMYRSVEELKAEWKTESKELKAELKENTKGIDRVLDNHTERIIKLEDSIKELKKRVEVNTSAG